MTRPTLILVRHGETEGQSSIRYHGRSDVPLSELGRAQMRAVALALADSSFAHVFASCLSRATEAARLIAGDAHEVKQLDEFNEVDFGRFEGLTAEEIAERYPDEFARWRRDRLDSSYTYPEGESRAAFESRVQRGVARMLELWSADGHGP